MLLVRWFFSIIISLSTTRRITLSYVHGFANVVVVLNGRQRQEQPRAQQQQEQYASTKMFAGFGKDDTASGSNSKKKKELKLKPKQQWDRFNDMKKEKKIRVGVRVTNNNIWLEAGNIRSKNDQYTEIAIYRQRALIAEHACRLFPLQVTQRDEVIWAFWDEESNEWIVVDKSVIENNTNNIPASVEKMIGFEGRPDPSTGYYCVYNEGRLVNEKDDQRPSSKKLK